MLLMESCEDTLTGVSNGSEGEHPNTLSEASPSEHEKHLSTVKDSAK